MDKEFLMGMADNFRPIQHEDVRIGQEVYLPDRARSAEGWGATDTDIFTITGFIDKMRHQSPKESSWAIVLRGKEGSVLTMTWDMLLDFGAIPIEKSRDLKLRESAESVVDNLLDDQG